jgi:hypothetical protein|tara:strand:+ start:412 stop:603 length:192 start_codon:yes stop_codon:yes gene_type:complete
MPALDSRKGSDGNTFKKARSIKPTAANFKSYPGNFTLKEVTSNWEDLTTNAFYVSNKTVWAKQ